MQNHNHSNPAREEFRRFAAHVSHAAGSAWAFAAALLIIAVWVLSGPVLGFSSTWQLLINTATTIVTFLMVFLIQSTQNRDARAIHLKLDELIKNNKRARNRLVDLEDVTEEELKELEREFRRVRARGSGQPDRNAAKKPARRKRLNGRPMRESSAPRPAP